MTESTYYSRARTIFRKYSVVSLFFLPSGDRIWRPKFPSTAFYDSHMNKSSLIVNDFTSICCRREANSAFDKGRQTVFCGSYAEMCEWGRSWRACSARGSSMNTKRSDATAQQLQSIDSRSRMVLQNIEQCSLLSNVGSEHDTTDLSQD